MQKQLVVFDVDGTLTRTMVLDTELYVEAVTQVLGLGRVDIDWSGYRNVTDTGVTIELIERHLGRQATRADLDSVRDRFLALLGSELTANPHRCRATLGAGPMLKALRAHARLVCAVATGAWRESALLKTRCAGVQISDLPMATCEDSHRRETILRTSVTRALSQYRLPEETGVVFVGDGVWDVRAAQTAGVRFVGIGCDSGAQKLHAAGASVVIQDFMDLPRFLDAVS